MRYLKSYKESVSPNTEIDIEYVREMMSDIGDEYKCFVQLFENRLYSNGISIDIYGDGKNIIWSDMNHKPEQIVHMLKLEGSEYKLGWIKVFQLGGFENIFNSVITGMGPHEYKGDVSVKHMLNKLARYNILEPGMNEYLEDAIFVGKEGSEYRFKIENQFEDDMYFSVDESDLETDIIPNINRIQIVLIK